MKTTSHSELIAKLTALGWVEAQGVWTKAGARVIPSLANPGVPIVWPKEHQAVRELLQETK